MEERLLFVGVSLGLFAWYSRRWKDRGGPVSPMQSAAWHALFYAIAAFSIVMILTMVFEGRTKVIAVPGVAFCWRLSTHSAASRHPAIEVDAF